MDPDDRALWLHATRHDQPLKTRLADQRASDHASLTQSADSTDIRRAPAAGRPLMSGPAPAPPETPPGPHRSAGIDKNTLRRLQRGQFPIEARLDLHGMTQARAHAALHRFIQSAFETGVRCVLVITGKGERKTTQTWTDGADQGVLRTMVPRWLAEVPLRRLVLTLCHARPHHGGAGAIYVLLRRRR